jgi:hypothetical protein
LYRYLVVISAFGALLILVACPAPQTQTPNKLQQSESRFWRKPDQKSSNQPAAAQRNASKPLDVEAPALPFDVAERIAADLDIGCGVDHPDAAAVTQTDPVQITPEGDKALLVNVRHPCICTVTGNCPRQVWTLDKDGHFERTLSDQAYEMLLANSVHNGHYDVVTESYLTARESTILRYEWDGSEYHPAEQSCRVGAGDVSTRPIIPGKCR